MVNRLMLWRINMVNWKNVRITWNNGYWKLFDTHRYQDLQIFDSAQDMKEWANARGAKMTNNSIVSTGIINV